MKKIDKKWLWLLVPAFFGGLTGLIGIWGFLVAKNRGGVGLELLILTSVVGVGLIFWVVFVVSAIRDHGSQSRISRIVALLYPFVTFGAMIFTIWFVVSTPLERELKVPMEYYAFHLDGCSQPIDGKCIKYRDTFHPIYSINYWTPRASTVERLSKKMTTADQGSRLIKFSDPKSVQEIVGIDEDVVLQAFGEPTDIYLDGEYTVWVYNPWISHSDWEIPVYIKNGSLVRIGN